MVVTPVADYESRIQYIEYELDDITEDVLRPEQPDPEFGENDPEPEEEEEEQQQEEKEQQQQEILINRTIKTEKPGYVGKKRWGGGAILCLLNYPIFSPVRILHDFDGIFVKNSLSVSLSTGSNWEVT